MPPPSLNLAIVSREVLSGVLSEFGDSIELPGLKLDAAGYCTLAIDSEMEVQISCESSSNSFNLSSPLGDLPGHSAQPLLSRFLQANFFGEGTRGASLCLAPDETSIYLWQRCSSTGLELSAFEKILQDFTTAASYWKNSIAEVSAHPPKQDLFPTTGAIPV